MVRADMGVAGLQEIGYQSNVIVLAGSFTDADGGAPYKASVRWTPTGAFTLVRAEQQHRLRGGVRLPVGGHPGRHRAHLRQARCLRHRRRHHPVVGLAEGHTGASSAWSIEAARVNPRYQARFGYNNPAPFAIYIPTLGSSENGFTSTPYLRGQPQVFLPGNKRNVFTTTFHTGSITWRLNGKTVVANCSSPRC